MLLLLALLAGPLFLVVVLCCVCAPLGNGRGGLLALGYVIVVVILGWHEFGVGVDRATSPMCGDVCLLAPLEGVYDAWVAVNSALVVAIVVQAGVLGVVLVLRRHRDRSASC